MRPKWKINSMPPQKPHAWNKVSNIQCKLFSSAKEKPRNKSLYGKKTHIPEYYLGQRSLKNSSVMVEHTHVEVWTSKAQFSTLGKNRFLSSSSTIIIWQFKIVIYFVSDIHHVTCALNPQLKFLDAMYVQNMSEGSDITGCSHSLSDFLLRNCFPHSEFKKPEALQSTPIPL